jgi:hypothetical protein
MRLSPVSLSTARRGAAFVVAVEAKTKGSLPSPTGSVDQRKSPGWHARMGNTDAAYWPGIFTTLISMAEK